MVRKVTLCCIVLVCVGVTLADYLNPVIGATICCAITFVVSRKQLFNWLISVSQKLENFTTRRTRRRRKRVVSVTSGYLLPWIEKVFAVIRSNKDAVAKFRDGNVSVTDSVLDASDNNCVPVSPSSENTTKHCGVMPTASEEIKHFVHNISKDFIQSWYQNISENEEFVGDLDYILEDVFIAICERLSRLNTSQLVHRILMIAFNQLLFIKESAGKQSFKQTLHGTNFKILHPALKDEKTAYIYLTSVCEILIDIVGPSDLLVCTAVRTFLVDILTKTLWLPLLQLLSDPQWMYEMIIYIITDADAREDYSKYVVTSDNTLKTDPDPVIPMINIEQDFTNSNGISSIEQSDSSPKATRPKTLIALDNSVRPKKHSSKIPHISIQSSSPSSSSSREHKRLSKTKSISLESLYDMCAESLPHKLSKEFSQSSTQLGQLVDSSPAISTGEEAVCSSDDGKMSPMDIKPFSLFPAEGLDVERSTPANFDALPSPNRLPKKLSFVERIRPSKSLELLQRSSNSLPANMRFASSVFQKFPGAQEEGTMAGKYDKPQALTPAEVEEAEEVTEIENMNPFLRVFINGTREQMDPKQKIYILYSIQVEYVEIVSVMGEHQRVIRTGTAERRFKEFIALQSKLEHPRFKKHIKGICGPTKFLTMHISPKDKKNIEKRRNFLQKYLKELCGREAIFKNHDLQLFLGIQGDPRLEFVQNAPEFPNIPFLFGLGKVMQPVKEAITKLTMPSQFSENGCGDVFQVIGQDRSPTQSRSLLPSFGKSKQEAKLPPIQFNCRKMSVLEQDVYNFLDRFDVLSSSPEESRPGSPNAVAAVLVRPYESSSWVPRWKGIANHLQTIPCGPRPQGDGCDSPESQNMEIIEDFMKFNSLQDCLSTEVPHANTLIDILICLLLPNNALSSDYMAVTLKVVFGDLIQCWLQKNLKEMTSQERCIYCLHLLHNKLWPLNALSLKPIVSSEQYKAALFDILLSSFPGVLQYSLGQSELKENLKFFLDCMGDPLQNRNLMYQIIDVVIEMICTQELQDCSM